ncbi:unnamed protein product [Linum trigynum]|uniref:Uncharacterized protein n=1 Tax=Linum trigynum TaxID=586398 RepID=A0AAV2CNF5_9ROSI
MRFWPWGMELKTAYHTGSSRIPGEEIWGESGYFKMEMGKNICGKLTSYCAYYDDCNVIPFNVVLLPMDSFWVGIDKD